MRPSAAEMEKTRGDARRKTEVNHVSSVFGSDSKRDPHGSGAE